MKVHRVNLSHAQYAGAQLLEAVIDAAEPRFKLAKLEGDAAFFYAVAKKGEPDIASLAEKVAAIRRGSSRPPAPPRGACGPPGAFSPGGAASSRSIASAAATGACRRRS